MPDEDTAAEAPVSRSSRISTTLKYQSVLTVGEINIILADASANVRSRT